MRRPAEIIFLALLITVFIPSADTFAHQPRIVEKGKVYVGDPEVSKVYYDELSGGPRIYRLSSEHPWKLYLNVLVPRYANGTGRYDTIVYDVAKKKNVAALESASGPWQPFWEEYGRDWYLRGPELRKDMPAGVFEIVVMGNGNEGKYALAIGERETFPLGEAINAVRILPKVKRMFFETNPADFILSPFGAGYVAVLFVLASFFGAGSLLATERFLKKKKGKAKKNVSFYGRIGRVAAGALLLVFAITTTWNPLILFASGFLYFEALSGRCSLYYFLRKRL